MIPSTSFRQQRKGISLLEMLVVLGIITLLVSLLLPALQKVRATWDAMRCAAQLRQLVQAAHQFEADHGRLPPGYLGPSMEAQESYPSEQHFNRGQWMGHLPLLMPYLEQRALVRDLNIDTTPETVTDYPWFWQSTQQAIHTSHYQVACAKLQFLLCPSVSSFVPEAGLSYPPGGGTLIGAHVFNNALLGVKTSAWKDDYVKSASFYPLGRTHYVGVAGCGSGSHAMYSKYEGIYTNRSRLTLGRVAAADGASNTLLYGEACSSRWLGSRWESMDLSWVGVGALGTYGGLPPAKTGEIIHFSSFHPSGVTFAFADGSVRPIRRGSTTNPHTQDWLLLQTLAGWRDGGAIDGKLFAD